MSPNDLDLDKALLDPASVFDSPDAVTKHSSLSQDQKVKILHRWEYDCREMAVAEEENMGGGKPGLLDQVLAALNNLGADNHAHDAPTKQGGD